MGGILQYSRRIWCASGDSTLLGILCDAVEQVWVSSKPAHNKNHLFAVSVDPSRPAQSQTFGFALPFFIKDTTCPSMSSNVRLTHGSNHFFI
jgi:hypothetical protein